MTLQAPNLDDRTFQQLVDEAKRYVQQRCPEWTDHNVSDPGITLIETFAWMTDLLLYRLNRVPERNRRAFLDLIGVRPFPPTAARTDLSFRLSAHQDAAVRIARGTEVATARTPTAEAIAFTTVVDLDIAPAVSRVVATMGQDGSLEDRTPRLGIGDAFPAFAARPLVNDALYVGLDQPAPATIVLLEIRCEVSGHGIDPQHPPLRWEAWDGAGWAACDLERDTTGGLNFSGSIELHVPGGHARSTVGKVTAAWLRCRVVELPGRAAYRSSPRIAGLTAATIGGDVAALHGYEIEGEVLGRSEGVAGQTFVVAHAPVVLSGDPVVVEVQEVGDLAWVEWPRVEHFAQGGPEDRHVVLDPSSGEVAFAPAVREADGGIRRYGAVPPKGATVRVRRYRSGGGVQGNVTARTLSRLRSSIPYVASVYNRGAARGGVDGERVVEAQDRARVALGTRHRAVTATDYEELTRSVAPELARVRCVLEERGADAGALRLLVVPAAPQRDGRIDFEDLIPDSVMGERIERFLDERRVVGTRVLVQPPTYLGLTVVVRLRASPAADPQRVRRDALDALYRYFNPLSGGVDGRGWPFGRSVDVGDVHRALQGLRGLDRVEPPLLFAADPITGRRAEAAEHVDLQPTNLIVSYEHDVAVDA